MEFKFDHTKENYCEAINVDKSVSKDLKDKKVKMMTEFYGKFLQDDFKKSHVVEIVLKELSYSELVLIVTEHLYEEFEMLNAKFLEQKLSQYLKEKKNGSK